MSPPTYLNFDLQIEPSDGDYRAQVVASPVDRGGCSLFSLRDLDARPLEEPSGEQIKAFGTRLFQAVFQGEVYSYLRRSQDEADRQGATGLRIRLLLTGVPELATLPWEVLYDPVAAGFLALSTTTPIVRTLDVAGRVQPLAVQGPLRVLALISSPADQVALDVEQEWARLGQALAGLEAQDRVVLERLESPTLGDLQARLRRGEVHVFHYIGHGRFDGRGQDGELILEDGDGYGQPVSGEVLGTLLHDASALRLAVLNACEGGRGSGRDPFAGVARTLVRKELPAVIAMQAPISDGAARIFAYEFYRALADDYPVDAALTEARKAIYRQGNELEWGTPVLFMRSPDGMLWGVEREEEDQVDRPEEGPWWEGISIESQGDVIIGYAGAGAQHTTIGKDVSIVLGESTPDDRQVVEAKLAETSAAVQRLRAQLEPDIAMMVDFQLKLLGGELTKTADGQAPSANTIIQVGDWLLDNVPQAVSALVGLFAAPAVGRVVTKAGSEAVDWVRARFGAA
jgi:hypothetical protein